MTTNLNLNNAEVTNAANDDASAMIEGTGWTWADAAAMSKECAREERLFGRRNRTTRRTRGNNNANRSAAAFLKATGWTIEAAAAMAKESMRDHRLFGGPVMYAAS